jgi:hypothetical protein
VFASRGWQRLALALNVIGGGILFFAFQATSSNLRLITTPDGYTAICVDKRTLIATGPQGGLLMGMSTCPDWEHSRPAAVVNFEYPWFVSIGFGLLMCGFLIQFLAVPDPKNIAAMRKTLREAKLQERLNKFKS